MERVAAFGLGAQPHPVVAAGEAGYDTVTDWAHQLNFQCLVDVLVG
jgi:hypothetical protein